MRKTFVNLCAVVLFSFSLIFLSAGFAKSFEGDAKKRSEIKAEWLKSAKMVVQKVNDPEVTKIFQFLEKNAILGAPHKQGVQFLEDSKSDDWFAILPLLKKDVKISEQWKSIFDVQAAAHFLAESRSMVLKDYTPYSQTGKAILFLHEGYHAYIFVRNPYDKEQDDRAYCYEEVMAHTFQNKVMSLLGGKAYQQILNKEVSRINAGASKSNEEFGVPSRTQYDKELAKVFGQPKSEMEKDFIQTSVWIHGVFVFLEKRFKGDAMEQKALFLRTLYKDGGII